jgi:hypothetical protein
MHSQRNIGCVDMRYRCAHEWSESNYCSIDNNSYQFNGYLNLVESFRNG